MRNMKSLVSHMIRLFLVASFLTSSVTSLGQIFQVISTEAKDYEVEIPRGKVLEILSFIGGPNYVNIDSRNGNRLEIYAGEEKNRKVTITEDPQYGSQYPQTPWYTHKLKLNVIAGPNSLLMHVGGKYDNAILTYKLTDNIASSTSKPASPKADDIKLTDEFLMLDYTVQANTTYKLGISKDMKNWKPLFEFTPESDKLNVELPKIILGNKSFLKLE